MKHREGERGSARGAGVRRDDGRYTSWSKKVSLGRNPGEGRESAMGRSGSGGMSLAYLRSTEETTVTTAKPHLLLCEAENSR